MANIQDNLHATAAPAVTDDSAAGYGVGSEWFNATSGIMYKCIDATVGAADWERIGISSTLWGIGKYRIPDYITGQGTGVPLVDQLYFHPFKIDHRVVIDRVGIRVTTIQAGSKCRLGIYAADPTTGMPGALVLDAGEKLTDSVAGDHLLTVSKTLKAGTYWTASLFTGSGTLPTVVRIGNSMYGRIPMDTLDEIFGATPQRYLFAAQAYGALPSTAPAAAISTGSIAPIVALRRAS